MRHEIDFARFMRDQGPHYYSMSISKALFEGLVSFLCAWLRYMFSQACTKCTLVVNTEFNR